MLRLVLIVVVVCVLMVSVGWSQSVPFDQCGTLQFIPVEGGCWKLYADDLVGYEIYGNLGGFTEGD